MGPPTPCLNIQKLQTATTKHDLKCHDEYTFIRTRQATCRLRNLGPQSRVLGWNEVMTWTVPTGSPLSAPPTPHCCQEITSHVANHLWGCGPDSDCRATKPTPSSTSTGDRCAGRAPNTPSLPLLSGLGHPFAPQGWPDSHSSPDRRATQLCLTLPCTAALQSLVPPPLGFPAPKPRAFYTSWAHPPPLLVCSAPLNPLLMLWS